MDTAPITCNHCGAALQVSDSTRFVTCRYCNSQLEIKRSESSITTEVLQHLDQNSTAIAQDLSALRRDSEVERLDREWQLRREGLMTKRRDGTSAAPAAAVGYIMLIWGFIGGLVGLIMFSLFGAFFAALIANSGLPAPCSLLPCALPLIVLGIIAINTVMAITIIRSAKKFQAEEAQYQLRRQQLLAGPVAPPPAPPANEVT